MHPPIPQCLAMSFKLNYFLRGSISKAPSPNTKIMVRVSAYDFSEDINMHTHICIDRYIYICV